MEFSVYGKKKLFKNIPYKFWVIASFALLQSNYLSF